MRWAGMILLVLIGVLGIGPASGATECPTPSVGQMLVCTREAGSETVGVTALVPGATTPVSTGAASATLDVLTQITGPPDDPKPTTTITKRPGAPAQLPVSVQVLIGLPGGVTLSHGYDARQSSAPQSAELSFPVMILASSQLRLLAKTATSQALTLTAGAGPVSLNATLPQPVPEFEVGVQALPTSTLLMSGTGVFDAVLNAALPGLTASLSFDDVTGKGALSLPSPNSFAWAAEGPAKKVSATATTSAGRVQVRLDGPPQAASITVAGGTLTYAGSGVLPGADVALRSTASLGAGTLALRYVHLETKQMPNGSKVDLAADSDGVGLSVPGNGAVGRLSLMASATVPAGPGGVITINPGPPDDFGVPVKEPVIVRVLDPFSAGEDTVELDLFDMRSLRITSGNGVGFEVNGGEGRRLQVNLDATDYDTMAVSSDAATPQTFVGTLDTLPGVLKVSANGPNLRYEASGPVARIRLMRDDQRSYDARDLDVLATDLPTVVEARPILAGGYRVDASAAIGTFAARVSDQRSSPALGFSDTEDGVRLLDTGQRYEVSVRATGLKKAVLGTAQGIDLHLEHGGGRDLLASVDRQRPQEFSELIGTVRAKKIPARIDFNSAGRGLAWDATSAIPELSGVVDRRQGNGAGTRRVIRFEVVDLPVTVTLSAGGASVASLATTSAIGRLRVASGGPEVTQLPAVGKRDRLERTADTAAPGVTALLRGIKDFTVTRKEGGQARMVLHATGARNTVLRNVAGGRTFSLGVFARPATIDVGVLPDTDGSKVIGKKLRWRASSAIKRLEVGIDGIELMKKWQFDEDADLEIEGLPKKLDLRFGSRISLSSGAPVSLSGRLHSDRPEIIPAPDLPSKVDGIALLTRYLTAADNAAAKLPISAARLRLQGLRSLVLSPDKPSLSVRRDKARTMLVKQRLFDSKDKLVESEHIRIAKVPASLEFSLEQDPVVRARYRASAPISNMQVDIRHLPRNHPSDRRGTYLNLEDLPATWDLCWHRAGRSCVPVYDQHEGLKGNLDWDLLLSRKAIRVGSFALDASSAMRVVDLEICRTGGKCEDDDSQRVRTGVVLRDLRIPARLAFEAHFDRNSWQIGQVSSGKPRPVQGWLYLDTNNDPISGRVELARYDQTFVRRVTIASGEHRAQNYVKAFDMYSFLQAKTWRTQTTGTWRCDGRPSVELEVGQGETKLLKALSGIVLSSAC